jgi:putative SOS response-associated peptidase YedK
LINARSESVTEKPSFRSAFKRRRCIVPASGFYEWQHFSDGRKQPYYIHAVNGSPLGFAGLWEHWQAPDGSAIESCTILTTSANATMAAIHDRMPVILLPGSYLDWLGAETSSSTLHKLCSPCPDYLLEMYPVSTMANSPRNDSPQCIERVTT